jgi:hypothetical protein
MPVDPLVDRDCALLDGNCTCAERAECKYSPEVTNDGRDVMVTAVVARESNRHAEAVERERIARMVERADNSMMTQTKLAAYIRGQETP